LKADPLYQRKIFTT